jgi:co-chaperonin GroES (HSP10)
MLSPNFFIVKPKDGLQYVQKKASGIIESASVEDVSNIQRIAVILKLPANYKGLAKEGDECIINHNIFRIYYNDKGVPVYSDNYIKEDMFYVEPERIYMLIRNGQKISLDDYIFVKPLFTKDKFESDVEVRQVGLLKYGNKHTESLGLKEGNTILFKIYGEHKYEIDGEILYRMANSHVLAELN